MAGATRVYTILLGACGARLTLVGVDCGEGVRYKRDLGGSTDRRRDSEVTRNGPAKRPRLLVAAEKFPEPCTVRCRTTSQCQAKRCDALSWRSAASRTFGRPSCTALHRLAARPGPALLAGAATRGGREWTLDSSRPPRDSNGGHPRSRIRRTVCYAKGTFPTNLTESLMKFPRPFHQQAEPVKH